MSAVLSDNLVHLCPELRTMVAKVLQKAYSPGRGRGKVREKEGSENNSERMHIHMRFLKMLDGNCSHQLQKKLQGA